MFTLPVVYFSAVVLFCIFFVVTKIKISTQLVFSISRHSLTVLTNPALSDEEKEKTAQKAAFTLIKVFTVICLKSFICLLMAIMPILLSDFLNFTSFQAVSDYALRPEIIVITTITLIGLLFLKSKTKLNAQV